VGYIRVSTAMQVEHGVSLDAQEARIRQYADLYGLAVTAIERDEGLSSKTLERPGLKLALAHLDEGRAQALLVTHLDRLTRRLLDLSWLVEHYFRDGKYNLLAVHDSIDTRTASGRLALNILGSVSQWEREAIGERTAQAMRQMRVNGEYTGGRVPYGWKLTRDGKLVRDDLEQEIIALAVEMRRGGASLRKISKRLGEDGYRSRSGAPLAVSSLAVILKQQEDT
jgi:DNA invertase Pin-like site-specific DNA recombinase